VVADVFIRLPAWKASFRILLFFFASWSSNSRWIVFSSKRNEGIFGKLFFSYLDSNGVAHRPLVLPQEDPRFYESFTKSFQRAEFTTEPFKVSPADLNEIIGNTDKIITAYYAEDRPH
jgi:hypothetical protein